MEGDTKENRIAERLKAGAKLSRPTGGTGKNSHRFSRTRATLRHREISSHDWSLFWGTLARMLEAGIGLSHSLAFQSDNTTNPRLARIAETVSQSVLEGKSFHLSCTAPEFKSLHVALIRVGEETGRLPEILIRLASFEEEQARLRLAIRSAITYPLILLFFLTAFILIIPVFFEQPVTHLFTSASMEVPGLLKLFFVVSSVLCDFRTLVFIALVGIIWYGVLQRLLASESVQRVGWKAILFLPGSRRIAQTVSEQRLAGVLAFTRSAGVSAVRSFELVGETMGNPIFRTACFGAADHIEQGGDVLTAIRSSGVASGSFLTVIAAGEEAGRLPELLESYAKLLSLKLEENLKSAVAVIQPVLLGGLALLILVLAVNVIGPLSRLVETL